MSASIAGLLLACSKPTATTTSPTTTVDGASSAQSDSSVPERTDAASASADAGASAPFDDAYLTAKPTSGKSIGHTSIVFKLGLGGDLNAAYKPKSKTGSVRFRGEIAAYRLAVAWGLTNVPPANFRTFQASELRSVLDAKAQKTFDDEVVAEADGTVRGAIIPWIPKLEFIALEKDEQSKKWRPWLGIGVQIATTPTGCDAKLAGQISTMVAFDLITANWDRWSGGNIGVAHGECDELLFIDNDGTFFDPVPAELYHRQLTSFNTVKRFSKSFVTALKTVSDDDLRAALGEESPGKPLLPDRTVNAAIARKKIVLSSVQALIGQFGEATILSLP
ncbi:MAG TPA: hypothetical protein VF407_12155 [Polyangiaceae bacterium]